MLIEAILAAQLACAANAVSINIGSFTTPTGRFVLLNAVGLEPTTRITVWAPERPEAPITFDGSKNEMRYLRVFGPILCVAAPSGTEYELLVKSYSE